MAVLAPRINKANGYAGVTIDFAIPINTTTISPQANSSIAVMANVELNLGRVADCNLLSVLYRAS